MIHPIIPEINWVFDADEIINSGVFKQGNKEVSKRTPQAWYNPASIKSSKLIKMIQKQVKKLMIKMIFLDAMIFEKVTSKKGMALKYEANERSS